MNTKNIAILLVIILAVGGLGAYLVLSDDDGSKKLDTAGKTVTDAVGREVVVPETLENGIVTIGSSGPLRFLSCFDVYDMVVEVDKGDVTDSRNGRAYSYAYDYKNLERYHADNALDASTVDSIVKSAPSLVIVQESVWNGFTVNCESLAKYCTVIVLKGQSMTTMWDEKYDLSPEMKFNFNLLGTMLGKEARATEVIDGIGDLMKDIRSFKGTSSENVYVAGVTISGSNTLNTTFPIYMPLTLIGGNNAYNGTSTQSKVVINVEEFAKMDIDMMVIDPSSSDKMAVKESQLVLQYVYGINNDSNKDNDIDLFVTVPIVWDSINYDCALASAYYMEYLLYGTLTHDQVVEKINNIFKVFYGDHGKNVLDDMSEFFVGKSKENSVELPILEEVKISKNGDIYSVVKA